MRRRGDDGARHLTAGSLVLASGAWMPELVPILGKTEHVVKQAIGWFGVRRPELSSPTASLFSSSPWKKAISTASLSGSTRLQARRSAFRARADRPQRHRPHAEREAGRRDPAVPRPLPARRRGDPLTIKGCMYTVTPDEHFRRRHLPDAPQVVAVSPCSGHGYKFCSVLGEKWRQISRPRAKPGSTSPRCRSAGSPRTTCNPAPSGARRRKRASRDMT